MGPWLGNRIGLVIAKVPQVFEVAARGVVTEHYNPWRMGASRIGVHLIRKPRLAGWGEICYLNCFAYAVGSIGAAHEHAYLEKSRIIKLVRWIFKMRSI